MSSLKTAAHCSWRQHWEQWEWTKALRWMMLRGATERGGKSPSIPSKSLSSQTHWAIHLSQQYPSALLRFGVKSATLENYLTRCGQVLFSQNCRSFLMLNCLVTPLSCSLLLDIILTEWYVYVERGEGAAAQTAAKGKRGEVIEESVRHYFSEVTILSKTLSPCLLIILNLSQCFKRTF